MSTYAPIGGKFQPMEQGNRTAQIRNNKMRKNESKLYVNTQKVHELEGPMGLIASSR